MLKFELPAAYRLIELCDPEEAYEEMESTCTLCVSLSLYYSFWRFWFLQTFFFSCAECSKSLVYSKIPENDCLHAPHQPPPVWTVQQKRKGRCMPNLFFFLFFRLSLAFFSRGHLCRELHTATGPHSCCNLSPFLVLSFRCFSFILPSSCDAMLS